jgi:hypothetical protein
MFKFLFNKQLYNYYYYTYPTNQMSTILEYLLLATLGVNWKWTSSSLSELRTWYPVSGILMSKNNNNWVEGIVTLIHYRTYYNSMNTIKPIPYHKEKVVWK